HHLRLLAPRHEITCAALVTRPPPADAVRALAALGVRVEVVRLGLTGAVPSLARALVGGPRPLPVLLYAGRWARAHVAAAAAGGGPLRVGRQPRLLPERRCGDLPGARRPATRARGGAGRGAAAGRGAPGAASTSAGRGGGRLARLLGARDGAGARPGHGRGRADARRLGPPEQGARGDGSRHAGGRDPARRGGACARRRRRGGAGGRRRRGPRGGGRRPAARPG